MKTEVLTMDSGKQRRRIDLGKQTIKEVISDTLGFLVVKTSTDREVIQR